VTAGPDGAVAWIEARSVSYAQPVSYLLWQQVLRQAIGAQVDQTPETVRQLLTAECERRGNSPLERAFLEAVLGVESAGSREALADVEAHALPGRIAATMRAFLGKGALLQPTVLVLDDLHWADRASADLLADVATLTMSHPVLIVGLLRPDHDTPIWPALERVRQTVDGAFTELALEPLSVDESRTLLGNLLHIEELPEHVRELVVTKTDGNPFFVEEVLRDLIDSGYVVQDDGHWRATREIAAVSIPDTLMGVLTARIDRLPEETKRVAQAASVMGRIFAYRVLKSLCAEAPPPERIERLEPHVDTLTREELVRERAHEPEIEYIFKHALTQEAAYSLMLLRRRKEMHRRVSAVLEQLYPERLDDLAPVLVHHSLLGEDWARAADYALRAGERAMRLYAVREAMEHYQQAYDALNRLPDPPGEKVIDAILGWAAPAFKLRPHDEVLARLAQAEALARELGDKRRLANVLHWIANVHLRDGFASRSVQYLLENFQLANELGDESLSILPSWFMAFMLVYNDPRSGVVQLQHVIELARANHNREIEAHALGTMALGYARLGEFSTAYSIIEEALTVARMTDAPVLQLDVDLLAAMVYIDAGDIELGLSYSRIATQRALAQGAMECAGAGFVCTGMANLEARKINEALSTFEESLKIAPDIAHSPPLVNEVRAGLAISRFFSGDLEARKDMEQSLENSLALDDVWMVATLRLALGEGATLLGDFDQAETYLTQALDYYRGNDIRPYEARTLRSLGNLYDAQGREEEARLAREEAERLSPAQPGTADSIAWMPAESERTAPGGA
jgi:tetratricopeptide (TPR) repeat protein